MKSTFVFAVIAFLAFSSVAQAGFEWLPPSQNPAPVVMERAEPVQAPILPQRKNLSAPRSQELVIDPYPLRGQGGTGPSIYSGHSSFNQAMAEEARVINPLPLGAGLTTGMRQAARPFPSAPKSNDYQDNVGSGNGLTPMMGGDPAPLPGMSPKVIAVPLENYAQAIGFGRDLPLGLAISQVIPESFSHSYAAGVDAGDMVSWEGGKPWNQVLNEMLKPKNLTASIAGNQVTIHPISRL